MNAAEAQFVGWYCGDGCLSTTNRYFEMSITGDDSEEIGFYKKVVIPYIQYRFNGILKKRPKVKVYPSVGVCGFYSFDRNFVQFVIKRYGLRFGKKLDLGIPDWIRKGTKKTKKAFLRGFFDTDGSVFFCKSNSKDSRAILRKFHYKPKIKIATISKKLMEQTYAVLLELGFNPMWGNPKKQRPNENMIYTITIHSISDFNKWLDEIGFNSEKHITKIEVWKKYGVCPPKTSLKDRKILLANKVNISKYYPMKENELTAIKRYVSSSYFCET